MRDLLLSKRDNSPITSTLKKKRDFSSTSAKKRTLNAQEYLKQMESEEKNGLKNGDAEQIT